MPRRLALLPLLGLTACAPTAGPASDLEPVARCSASFCGGNSPEIGHYGLHELNLDHQRNAEGFAILGVSKGVEFYELEVKESRFVAFGGSDTLTGTDLAGVTIWLERGGRQFGVVISAVGGIDEVVGTETLETYVLEWADVIGNPLRGVVGGGEVIEPPQLAEKLLPVCPDPGPWQPGVGEWDEAAVMAPYDSIVFEGDRIDDVTRTVAPVPDDRWFNLGCARHTLAKLRLTRSTLHTVKSGAWQQVQATLKMLSADYCGTGKAFTIAGEPIVWKNNVGMKYYFPPSVLEARWSENGALCLNTPRLESPAYPDVELDIAAECARPPSCANPDPYATEKFELVTSSDY